MSEQNQTNNVDKSEENKLKSIAKKYNWLDVTSYSGNEIFTFLTNQIDYSQIKDLDDNGFKFKSVQLYRTREFQDPILLVIVEVIKN